MKTRECIHCETFFDCNGKPSRNPCVNFKDRRKEKPSVGFDEIFQQEMGKLYGENKQ